MKTSVIVIAHNEEKNIEKCLLSIINQTKKADEILLIVHNSRDKTLEIANKYPSVKKIKFEGEEGIVSARTEALSYPTGDIILCIDGDGYAKNNWVEEMTKTLSQNNNVLVGSWVKFEGSIFGRVSNIFNKLKCVSTKEKALRWIWGGSFAFWRKDIDFVKKSLEESVGLSSSLGLTRNPEDFCLALYMIKKGRIEVINKTHVVVREKEQTSLQSIKRNTENKQNALKITKYLEKKS